MLASTAANQRGLLLASNPGSILASAEGGWCGHEWSPWAPLTATVAAPSGAAGVYRIRGGDNHIVYIVEGIIATRLAQHRRSASTARSPQGQAFAVVQPLTCSWVVNQAWEDHHRLELENDLIAEWVLATGSSPSAQFCALGAGRDQGVDNG